MSRKSYSWKLRVAPTRRKTITRLRNQLVFPARFHRPTPMGRHGGPISSLHIPIRFADVFHVALHAHVAFLDPQRFLA